MIDRSKLDYTSLMRHNDKVSVFTYIAMLLMLYLTDSGIVIYGQQSLYYVSLICCIVLASVCFFRWLFRGTHYVSRSFILFGFIIVWIGAKSLIGGSGVGPTIKYVSLLVTALYVSRYVKFESFLRIYVDVCFILAVVALAMWLIVFLFPNIYDLLPELMLKPNNSHSTTLVEYRTVFLANMHKSNYTLLDRVYSIFWEPGVCQAYFNIALIYTVQFIRGKKQLLYSIVYIIAIVLTLSTGGYLTLACVIGLILFSKNNKSKESRFLLKILLYVGIIAIVVSFATIQDSDIFVSVFGKLESGSDHQSVASRMNSITGNLYVLRDNFFMGAGLNRSSEALKTYGIYTNQTNTILDYFATFGFFIGTVYTICWCFFIRKLGKRLIEILFLFMAFMCIFFSEDYIGSIHFYILMLYGARSWLDKQSVDVN